MENHPYTFSLFPSLSSVAKLYFPTFFPLRHDCEALGVAQSSDGLETWPEGGKPQDCQLSRHHSEP